MALKYVDHLRRCAVHRPCPDAGTFAPRQMGVAFRFMHSPATEAGDFVPPAILDGVKKSDKCGRFALSFFETLDAARRRYAKLAERVDAESKYGGFVGEMSIEEGDGIASLPSSTLHLDLHQNDGVAFVSRVTTYHAA
jgi:hypothetical protein